MCLSPSLGLQLSTPPSGWCCCFWLYFFLSFTVEQKKNHQNHFQFHAEVSQHKMLLCLLNMEHGCTTVEFWLERYSHITVYYFFYHVLNYRFKSFIMLTRICSSINISDFFLCTSYVLYTFMLILLLRSENAGNDKRTGRLYINIETGWMVLVFPSTSVNKH